MLFRRSFNMCFCYVIHLKDSTTLVIWTHIKQSPIQHFGWCQHLAVPNIYLMNGNNGMEGKLLLPATPSQEGGSCHGQHLPFALLTGWTCRGKPGADYRSWGELSCSAKSEKPWRGCREAVWELWVGEETGKNKKESWKRQEERGANKMACRRPVKLPMDVPTFGRTANNIPWKALFQWNY